MTEPTREQLTAIIADTYAHPTSGGPSTRAVCTLALEALDGRNNRKLGAAVRASGIEATIRRALRGAADLYANDIDEALLWLDATALRSETT